MRRDRVRAKVSRVSAIGGNLRRGATTLSHFVENTDKSCEGGECSQIHSTWPYDRHSLSVSSPVGGVRREQVTANPVLQALRYASRLHSDGITSGLPRTAQSLACRLPIFSSRSRSVEAVEKEQGIFPALLVSAHVSRIHRPIRHWRLGMFPKSLRSHELSSESAKAQSLLKLLAGIFRKYRPRPYGGLVCFGGCAVCAVCVILAPVCVRVIAVTRGREERVYVAGACLTPKPAICPTSLIP